MVATAYPSRLISAKSPATSAKVASSPPCT